MIGKPARRCRTTARQKGAEIVEFLITLPVVLIVLAILFDFGSLFADQIVLTNAARAAAREVISGATDDQAQLAADRVTASLLGADSASLPTVNVVRDADVSDDPGDQITVTVNHAFTFRLLPGFAGSATSINLSATVRMNMLPT